MSVSLPSCCISLQNHQQVNYHLRSYLDRAAAENRPSKSKTCTVIENGRVVVKLLPETAEICAQPLAEA